MERVNEPYARVNPRDVIGFWDCQEVAEFFRLDEEVLGYFRRKGKGYQTAINAALRKHVDEQKKLPLGQDLLLPFESRSFTKEYCDYYRAKRTNFFASIQSFTRAWKAFLLLDAVFLDEFADIENVRDSKQFLPLLLLIQAHSQFRLAAELGFSTVTNESGAILRQGIESAAFAYKLHKEPELASVWLTKNDSKKNRERFHQTFIRSRRESLFSYNQALEELYSYWCNLSELSSHSNLIGFGKRITHQQSQTHVNWFLGYFEVDRHLLASSLFSVLHVGHLIERVSFSIFELRLKFDEALLKKRDLSSKYVQQVGREMKAEFNRTSESTPVDE